MEQSDAKAWDRNPDLEVVMKSSKGSAYEREVCEKLSMWWSGDPSQDDLFWRVYGSGGRATRRGGRRTQGGNGDIAPTGNVGSTLCKLVTIECKRGYPKALPGDSVDRSNRATEQAFTGFIKQSIEAAQRAKTPYWLLIHRRNGRVGMVYMTAKLYKLLKDEAGFKDPIPRIGFTIELYDPEAAKIIGYSTASVVGFKFSTFLKIVKPKHIKAIYKCCKSSN